MIGSMSVQYFSSSLRSKEGAQYYGTFTFWKGELFTSCVAGYFWKYTSFVTCVDSPGYIALHIQIVRAGNRTKKRQMKVFLADYEYVEGDYDDDGDADDADVVYLLPAVRRQVEGEHCEEGDAHAGDD